MGSLLELYFVFVGGRGLIYVLFFLFGPWDFMGHNHDNKWGFTLIVSQIKNAIFVAGYTLMESLTMLGL